MSQPEDQPHPDSPAMPVLTTTREHRKTLVARMGREAVVRRDFSWSNHNPGRIARSEVFNGNTTYLADLEKEGLIAIGDTIASNLLAFANRITPPIAACHRDKVVRTISACISRFLKWFTPHDRETFNVKRSLIRHCLYYNILDEAYIEFCISTNLFSFLAMHLDYILDESADHLYAARRRKCVSCGKNEPPPQLLN